MYSSMVRRKACVNIKAKNEFIALKFIINQPYKHYGDILVVWANFTQFSVSIWCLRFRSVSYFKQISLSIFWIKEIGRSFYLALYSVIVWTKDRRLNYCELTHICCYRSPLFYQYQMSSQTECSTLLIQTLCLGRFHAKYAHQQQACLSQWHNIHQA